MKKLASLTFHTDKDLVFVLPTLFAYYDKTDNSFEIGITFLSFTILITINKSR